MALQANQLTWIENFSGMEAVKDAFDREQALKAEYLTSLRKKVDKEREYMRKAMDFEVTINGKKVGKMLDDSGTQLDEVDFSELKGPIEMSPEQSNMIARVTGIIATWTEDMKQVTVDRDGARARLFTDQEISDELYTPLVRERVLAETVIGNQFSATQKMIDETNALYEARIAQKKEDGELDEYDRTSALLTLGSGMTKAGAEVAGAFGADTAKNVLELMSMTADAGNEIRDAAKAGDISAAITAVRTNMGSILEKCLSMSGIDAETAKLVNAAYATASATCGAAQEFAKGEAGLSGGLDSLGDALIAAAGPVSDPETKKALILAANGFKSAGHGYNIGKNLALGNADLVIEGLTKAAKQQLSTIISIETINKTKGQDEKQAEKTEGEQSAKQESIEELIDWSSLGLTTAVATYDSVKKGNIQASVHGILDAIGGVLSAVLKRSGVPDETADMIADSYNGACQIPKIAGALIQNPPDKSGALEALGNGIEHTFNAASRGDPQMKKVGASIGTVFATIGSGIDIKKAYDNDDFDGVVAGLEKAAERAVGKVFSVQKDVETADMSDEDAEQREGEIDDDETEVMAEMATSAAVTAGLALLKKTTASDIEAANIADAEQAGLDILAQNDAEVEEMKRMLQQGGEAGEAAANASSIDKLIAKMMKDRMILDLAAKISAGGMALAEKFCAPMGAAAAAVKMAANICAAAQRAKALHTWVNLRKDFEKAQSSMSSAAQNFVKNQAEQFSHYTIQAAFEAAQMIGKVCACSGIATAAGEALAATASAASAMEESLYQFVRQEVLQASWKKTCKAFNNPANRKLALQVRALNPTLAKYTIAWGATKANHPLAKNAVASCGLNETTLSQKDTNADKVVDYLEAYFRDDLTLYREIELDGKWLPSSIELTAGCWSAIKVRAVKNVDLQNAETGKLDGLLTKLSKLQAGRDLEDMIDELEAAEAAATAALLEQIAAEFSSYTPDCKEPGKKVMKSAVNILKKQASDHRTQALQKTG